MKKSIFDDLEITAFDDLDVDPEDKVLYSKEILEKIRSEVRKEISNLPVGNIISKLVKKESEKIDFKSNLIQSSFEAKNKSLEKEIESLRSQLKEASDTNRVKHEKLVNQFLSMGNERLYLGGPAAIRFQEQAGAKLGYPNSIKFPTGSITINADGSYSISGGISGGPLTSGRVPFATTGGALTDIASFTFSSGAGILNANGFNGALNGSVGATSPSTGVFTSLSYGTGAGVVGPITNGTYTPTPSAGINLDSTPTMQVAQYSQNANVITVSGRFIANPTLAATTTSFEFTLPTGGGFDQDYRLAGVAFCGAIAGMGAEITASMVSQTNALVTWKSTDVNSQSWSYIIQYLLQPAV